MKLTPAVTRTIALEVVAAEVAGALAGAGIPSILLKGTSTARLLYPGEFRPQADADLLVPPDHWAGASSVLEGLGFVPPPDVGPVAHAATFLRTDGAAIDLHRRLWHVAGGTLCWQVLSNHTVREVVWGHPVDMLTTPARVVVVALHAAQHGSEVARPQEDLRRAVETVPLADWQAARDIAEALGALGPMAIATRLIGATALAELLELPTNVPASVWLQAHSQGRARIFAEFIEGDWSHRRRALRAIVAPAAHELGARRWSRAVIDQPGGARLARVARWARAVWVAPGAALGYARGRRAKGRGLPPS